MKKFTLSDQDMGVDCDYVAEGDTKEEVMKMSKDHMMKDHPMESEKMMKKYSEKQMEEMMMEKIKEM